MAGTYHPIPYLLENITEWLPFVTAKHGVWRDYDATLNYSDTTITESLRTIIQVERSTTYSFLWKKSDSLLLNTTKSAKSQLSLSDEDELNVLYLYFVSPIDNLKDVLILQISRSLFLKNPDIEFSGISSQEKTMIINTLIPFLTAQYNRVFDERKVLVNAERINNHNKDKIEALSKKLELSQDLYSKSIRSILNEYKREFEKELKKNISLDNEVVYKLAREQFSTEEIKGIIADSIYSAYNLNLTAETLLITEEYLQLKERIAPISLESASQESVSGSDKVIRLLDNYEGAAVRAAGNGLAVNGKNVASHLNPPVTPPAITDAVKKNARKIGYLLKQYPERWINIRNGIRPIENLDDSKYNLGRTVS